MRLYGFLLSALLFGSLSCKASKSVGGEKTVRSDAETSQKTKKEEARDRVLATLAVYAEGLQHAYATGRTDLLAKVAAPREVERVATRVSELADEGKFLDVKLLRQDPMEIDFPRATMAFAAIQEVWSFEVKALGSQAVLAVEESQVQQVRYTLVLLPDGSWLVLSRAVLGEPVSG